MDASRTLPLSTPIVLTPDFVVFVVAQAGSGLVNPGEFLLPGVGPVPQCPWILLVNQIRARTNHNTRSVSLTFSPFGSLHLYVVRCVTGVCHYRLDGSELTTIPLPAGESFTAIAPASGASTQPTLNYLDLVELRVFGEGLPDAQFAATEQALRNAYGL
jgi:hypothetical protein